jgi:CBS domain-containing protein/PII-like signaling protein
MVLERLQREGATGATALRGLSGFGPGQQVMTNGSGPGAHDSPVVIEWIDRADRVARILPMISDVLPRTMITLEDIQVYRAVLRAQGPLAGAESAGSVMATDIPSLPYSAQVGQALSLMLEQHQSTVPVLDGSQSLVGVITEQDLLLRGGLPLPLHLMRLLNEQENSLMLAPVVLQPVHEVMNHEPRSIFSGSDLSRALTTMIEWNYEQIPVTDRHGAFAGLLSADAILQTTVAHQPEETDTSNVEDADPPTPVQLIMQQSVAHVPTTMPLNQALQHMLAAPNRYLVVVDEERRVVGSLGEADVLQFLEGDERASWIVALREKVVAPATLPGANYSVAQAMQPGGLTLAPTLSLMDAARAILTANCERAPVVDEDGHLLGLLGRSGLLRALLQESRI